MTKDEFTKLSEARQQMFNLQSPDLTKEEYDDFERTGTEECVQYFALADYILSHKVCEGDEAAKHVMAMVNMIQFYSLISKHGLDEALRIGGYEVKPVNEDGGPATVN